MNITTLKDYHARFHKVLQYIDEHLDDELTVETLSNIAAFSKFHFHRQFSELFGISVYKYVQFMRLKRASFKLAFRNDSIIDIALESGYEGPEAFSRAFKKEIGQTPSEYRKQPKSFPWQTLIPSIREAKEMNTKQQIAARQVEFREFPETRVAVLEHRGDPARLGDSIRKFIEWRKSMKLNPKVSATFNIFYDDPSETAPEDFRFDLCVATDKDITSNNAGIIEKIIPGGRCAVLRFVGSDEDLGVALRYLYSEWLPQSGEELRDFPLYCQRVSFFPDVPEQAAITDIFLPLK